MQFQISNWQQLDKTAQQALLERPLQQESDSLKQTVKDIIRAVRTEGDAADDGGRKQGLAGVHDVSPHHSIGCRRRCSITVAMTCAGRRRSPVRWRATYCVLRLR